MIKKKNASPANTDLRDVKVRIYVIMAIFILSMGGCAALNKFAGMPNDNPAEQLTEAIIEAETGISIDLTPED